jgi:hypothetical protein
MSNRRHQTRRESRPALLFWQVTYGNEERVGRGIVLDMHRTGCRIVGSMAVKAGMRLSLCLWPSQFPKETFETEGTVRWTKGRQFGLVLDTPQTVMR